MMDVGEEGEHNHGGMGGGRIMGDMRKRGGRGKIEHGVMREMGMVAGEATEGVEGVPGRGSQGAREELEREVELDQDGGGMVPRRSSGGGGGGGGGGGLGMAATRRGRR